MSNMIIDIDEAEKLIFEVLPKATVLAGEINTMGTFLVFEKINVNELLIGDVDYVFALYVSISSRTKSKRLAYGELSSALNALLSDFEENRKIEVGQIKPYAVKGLIVYQVQLTVKGFDIEAH